MMLLLRQDAPLPDSEIQLTYDLIAVHRGTNRVQVIKNRMGPPLGVMAMTEFELVVRKYLNWISKESVDESV
jgi:hypothetical protein